MKTEVALSPDRGPPTVEAVADEAAPRRRNEACGRHAAVGCTSRRTAASPEPAKAPPWLDEPLPDTRRHPLRFMWQMDR